MKPDTRTFYEQAVHRAAERIVGGLDTALGLEGLASEAAMSLFHFHRVFRGMVGETPLELHRRLRMERAAWRLLNGEAHVTAIAFDAGYEAHETFTRAFGAAFGCPPSEFRKRRVLDPQGCERPLPTNLTARSGIHFSPEQGEPFTFEFLYGDRAMDVEITNRPELRTASLRHAGPYNRISEAFGRLGQVAGRAGLFGPGATMLAVYHDDPETTPEKDLRSDAAVTISPTAAVPNGLTELVIPAGRYARTTHVGPYDKLGDVWVRLMGDWLPRSGHRVGEGVSYEVYRNNPMNAKPEELITDIYLPLK